MACEQAKDSGKADLVPGDRFPKHALGFCSVLTYVGREKSRKLTKLR
jgi:hypothetical protein